MNNSVVLPGGCLPTRIHPPLIWICALCRFPVVVQDPKLEIRCVAEHVVACLKARTA